MVDPRRRREAVRTEVFPRICKLLVYAPPKSALLSGRTGAQDITSGNQLRIYCVDAA